MLLFPCVPVSPSVCKRKGKQVRRPPWCQDVPPHPPEEPTQSPSPAWTYPKAAGGGSREEQRKANASLEQSQVPMTILGTLGWIPSSLGCTPSVLTEK